MQNYIYKDSEDLRIFQIIDANLDRAREGLRVLEDWARFGLGENDYVKRGDIIARLPEKVQFMCMARVRHLHLQIGQKYCQKEEKDNWGCKYFIKDFYNSLNPHSYWADGPNKVSCFNKEKKYSK